MLNKIVLQGRLTRDPELRRTNSGKAVTSFSIACEQDYKSSDGNRATDFFDCVAWEGRADFIFDHFHKGDMIILSGRLTNRDWTDKDGNKRRVAEIIVDGSYFGGSKKGDSGEPKAPQSTFQNVEAADVDLPF